MSSRKLAPHHKVSHTTILHDVKYGRAIDSIAAHVGKDAKRAILKRDVKIGKEQVQQLAEIAEVDPETAKEVFAQIRTVGTIKATNLLVRLVYAQVFGTKSSTGNKSA